jgi:F-type H+-transporting ATPase subunit O
MQAAVAGKYASAAFSAALSKSENQLKAVESDLNAIAQALESDPKTRDYISNPTLSPAEKKQGVQALLKSAKNGGDEVTKNIFEVLAENGRLSEAEKVIDEFRAIMSAHRGEVKITVTCPSLVWPYVLGSDGQVQRPPRWTRPPSPGWTRS